MKGRKQEEEEGRYTSMESDKQEEEKEDERKGRGATEVKGGT